MTAVITGLMDYDEAIERFDPVMGLEVHVELGTVTKMFCGCSTAFGAEPNTQVCPVCLALPGAMPTINGKAVEYAIRIGLALNCEIATWCQMSRKNYFYPDMPKNYQISQYDEPIAFNGYLDVDVDGEIVRVEIERAHMEEDTGTTTGPASRWSRSSPSRSSGPRRRRRRWPAPTSGRCVIYLPPLMSRTSGWIRGRSAATPTCP
jgi:Asp-tRNA(Asn)/Glu-tRNA(Gln) amidotransferase B subunit